MEVLEYPDMNWTAVHTCSKCGAKLLIKIEDVEKCGTTSHVSCAVCRSWEYPSDKLPWFVEAYASGGFVGWPPNHPLFGKRKRS